MPTIDRITIADEPEHWSALGFALESDLCRLGSVELRLAGAAAGKGISSWSLRDLVTGDLDGLPTDRSTRLLREPAAPHPNGAIAIDHVVVISPSFQRSVERMVAAGLDLRRVREEPTPAGAPRQAFFRLGAEILELVQQPDQEVEAKGGPERAPFFWGLALLVEDLDAAVVAMAPHVGEPRAAVQPGRRIATMRRSAGLAVPIALITRVAVGEAQT